ncbi:Uncharacterised protein [Clostridium baratii]|uniref:hypothetical protein n=1 Tax=Clostridium baratii TaxID=1561 RepID=UPI0006C03BCD|nr:hypothetical protein [Clostridium baratii]CUP08721.1 Uncharacterised protein [Clostridium baratii]
MRKSIFGFLQERAIELGLDAKDLLILRYIHDFVENGKMWKERSMGNYIIG